MELKVGVTEGSVADLLGERAIGTGSSCAQREYSSTRF